MLIPKVLISSDTNRSTFSQVNGSILNALFSPSLFSFYSREITSSSVWRSYSFFFKDRIVSTQMDGLWVIQAVLYWWPLRLLPVLLLQMALQWISLYMCLSIFLPLYHWDRFLELESLDQRANLYVILLNSVRFPSTGILPVHSPTYESACYLTASPRECVCQTLKLF